MTPSNHSHMDLSNDDYVAELLAKDARASSIRYSAMGLEAYAPKRPAGSAPKPNTRFLKNILRDTDSHNLALKKKEEEESRERLRRLRGESTAGSTKRLSKADGHESKRRRVDDDDDADDRKHNHPDRRERNDRHRSHRRDRSRDDEHRSHRSHRRRYRDDRSDISDEAHARRKEGRRQDSHDADAESMHSKTSRKHRHDNNHPRDLADTLASLKRSGWRRSRDKEDDERRSRDRYRSRSRSKSPRHRSRKDKRSDHSRRSRSPVACTKLDRQSRHPRSRSASPSKPNHEESSSKSKRRRDSSSDSDPLEDLIGPLPPSKDRVNHVRPRGRGAHRSSNVMDSHFSTDYDPSLDVHPESPEHGTDDWEMALEALRDRELWKRKGAERMREAGFGDEDIKRWEKSNGAPGTDALGRDIEDVVWARKGEGREWDRGKVLTEDGNVELQPEWGRLT